MKLISILGFLLIALSVPVLTFLGIEVVAKKSIPQLKYILFANTKMASERERLFIEIVRQRDKLKAFKDILARSKKPNDQKVFEKIEPRIDQRQKKIEALELQLKALEDKENPEAKKRERQKDDLIVEIAKQKNELADLKGILAQFKKSDDQIVFEKIESLIDQTQKKLEVLESQLIALREQEMAAQNNLPVQKQAIRLLKQTPFIFGALHNVYLNEPFEKLLGLISIVSILVFLSILILSRFFKSRFLRSSLLTGALATLILGITYDPITALLLTLAILYTTRKIYEPLDYQTYA